MTRVLQVVLSLNPGGTERLVVELAKRLHADIPIAVCCLDVAGAWSRDLERCGIRVVALGRRPGFHPGLGRAVARVARDHGADVLHAHHYSPFVYSCLARLSHRGIRVVFTEHGRLTDVGPSRKRRLANQVLARFGDAVYAVSEDVRQHLIAEGFSASKVGLIYNGIDIGPAPDTQARARVRDWLNAGEDVLVVGTIARLDRVKDLGTLIAAMRIVARDRRVCLLIIGDGPERRALETLAAEGPAPLDARFTGHLDNARDWLPGCDIYANSSITEGVSLTILEAMAAALPIVATNVGGTPEVVDASCGRLVPARDPAALAAEVAALAADSGWRRTLADAARARVGERFTLDRMVDEYRAVYRR